MSFDSVVVALQSLGAQWLIGTGYGGMVMICFKVPGDILSEKTNKAIGRRLRIKSVETAMIADTKSEWLATFSNVFDSIFGKKHFSWRCFLRSAVASTALYWLVVGGVTAIFFRDLERPGDWWTFDYRASFIRSYFNFFVVFSLGAIGADYFALLKTRLILNALAGRKLWLVLSGLILDTLLSIGIAIGILLFWNCLPGAMISLRQMGFSMRERPFWEMLPDTYWLQVNGVLQNWALNITPLPIQPNPLGRTLSPTIPAYASALMTSIWMWVYGIAVLIIRAIQRFDIVFRMFNTTFDIDKKPLQAIGFVAGALVASSYWMLCIVIWARSLPQR